MKSAIDEIKSAASAHGLINKIKGIVEGVETLATLLKAQAHNCNVTGLETTITNFIATVKSEGIEKVALEAVLHHGLSLIGDGKTLYEGIKSDNYNQIGMATGAVLNDIMDENFEFFFIGYTSATSLDDAKNFAQGFFSSFGADVTKCLDDTDMTNLVSDIDSLKAAFKSKKIGEIITSGLSLYSDIKDQSDKCDVKEVPQLVETFVHAIKQDGIERVLVNAVAVNFKGLIADAKNLISGFGKKDYVKIGAGFGGLMNHIMGADTTGFEVLEAAAPVFVAAPTPNSAALEDAREFIQGFFTNFGATVDSCIDDSDLASMKSAIDEIKSAASAHGLINKIKGIVEGVETLATLLKAQAHNCNVTGLETTITNFIATVKSEGIEKVALEAVLHHGLSLIGDGKTLYEGIKSDNYNQIGMATGAVLNDIMDENFEFFFIGYTSATSLDDAKNFAQGFFSSFGADVTKCLDDTDMTNLVSDIDSLKAAFKSKKIGEIITSGLSLYSDIKDQSDKCDVKEVPQLVETFVHAIKQDGIERVLVNAVAVNFKGLIADAKNLISGFGKKDYVKIGAGFGGLMNHIMGADTTGFEVFEAAAPVVVAAVDPDAVADAKTVLQGFFNAWGADISKCLDDSDFQKFANLIDSVRDAWKSGSVVEKLEKTALAVYSAWHLVQQEATQCKITQIDDAVEKFSAAVKTQGWETVLKGALQAHLMDLITDGQQIMSGIKSHNYELIGQAVGNVLRSVMDVQTSSDLIVFAAIEDDNTLSDVKTVVQGFFNAWGADITKCLDDSDFQKLDNLVDSVKAAWKSGTVVEKIEKTALAVYAAWNLVQDEANECKITQIEDAVEKFSAAVKTQGWETVLKGALQAHMMDLITDAEQIMSGVKSHNFELIGQAVGNVLRSAMDVQSSSLSFVALESDATIEDAKDFAQGFFSTFGADVTKCLDDNDFNSLVTDINNLKKAFSSKNIGEIVAAAISTYSDVKGQADKCDVKALPALVKEFIGAVKEDGIERVIANAAVINAVGLIKDVKNLISGFSKKNYVAIGTGVGGLMNHIMGADSPSVAKEINTLSFVEAAKTSEAEDFVRGFFGSFGADVTQCLDSADMQKVQSQIDDIKKAIKGNPVEALVVVVRDITEIVEEFKNEAQQCDVSAVEGLIKDVITAAKADGADKYILSVLMEHGLDMLAKVKTGVDAFESQDFETAGKAIGAILLDLKPNQAVEFLSGFLA